MATDKEIIGLAIVRFSIIAGRLVESITDAFRLDSDSVDILRDTVTNIAKQEMTTFMQEVNGVSVATPGTGYQPISRPDKHVIPPPKAPNETINNTKVTSLDPFYSVLRDTNIISNPLYDMHQNEHEYSSGSRLDVLEIRMQELEAEIAKLKQPPPIITHPQPGV